MLPSIRPNSTRYIPYSQDIFEAPAILTDRYDDRDRLEIIAHESVHCRT